MADILPPLEWSTILQKPVFCLIDNLSSQRKIGIVRIAALPVRRRAGRRMVKLAISGKGGAGKTTLAGALALLMARNGDRVLAVDADPDANLASALGVPAELQNSIVTIAQHKTLIEQRTGAKVKQYGQIFKLNPEVSDVSEKYAYPHEGVALLVLGAVDSGGSGCACPESVLLRSLVTDLVLHKDESLVMDMEAGVEHLGRATARGVDMMIVVIEPGQRSIDSALRVAEMSAEVGIRTVAAVPNKVRSPDDEQFIRQGIPAMPIIGSIPYSEAIRLGDRDGVSVLESLDSKLMQCFEQILNRLGYPDT
jgi:CO dehydrogenase maturation factor